NLRGLIKFLLRRDTTHNGEFAALWRFVNPQSPKIVIDVGANDGFYGSNSYPFIARGWRAVMIEPHPVVFKRLEKRFARSPQVTCLQIACSNTTGTLPFYVGADGEAPSLSTLCTDPDPGFRKGRLDQTINVKVDTLNNVLHSLAISRDIGVLSVDAEGMDYEVLLGLDFPRWRPRVIITENYRPKEAAKATYLTEQGYAFQGKIHSNTLWTTSAP
ncbi:MAG TPA: FkbM family methyltransferase, partial [Verrucomicrobiae bacterium]|nr:FkbM family methyltransferase [Verrucomicrobiae bacterium]